MTLEFSLRRRAIQSRCFAALWLSLAIIILVASYISLPSIAGRTLQSVNQIEGSTPSVGSDGKDTPVAVKNSFVQLHAFALIILALCLVAVSFASYLLGRCAFIELELAARFNGLADALLIAGDNFEQLERATSLLVPRPKYFHELSEKNLKTFLDIVKNLRR